MYAHTKPNKPISEWEPLQSHLSDVADLSEKFGEKFGFGSISRQLGLWHDLGKYSLAFQEYLIKAGEIACQEHSERILNKIVKHRVDHSTPGAQFAFRTISNSSAISDLVRNMLAYAIAGHHGGMPDKIDEIGKSGLVDRLSKVCEPLTEVPPEVAENFIRLDEFKKYVGLKNERARGFQFGFLNRMLFSTLVDADFLSTERFMRDGINSRPNLYDPVEWIRLNEIICKEVQVKSQGRHDNLGEDLLGLKLIQYRNELYKYCINASHLPRGFYQLEAPVGSGKTLSSLAFAVSHAMHNGMDRIIYGIPFTSIIDQTAGEFRKLTASLGAHFIVEHHSNLLECYDTTENRLQSENWDAPLVVTTNVQLFESLFSNRPSDCRKLHRITNSVIILDEAQTIPPQLLIPCLKALEELVRNYRVTVVICSATPPAIVKNTQFANGLQNLVNITGELNNRLKIPTRVVAKSLGTLSNQDLATKIIDAKQALCIVNTRAMAQDIFREIKSRLEPEDQDGLYHLSTWMCGTHRRQTLDEIKLRLKQSPAIPCRVISTQVVESGVDLDFPVVFRALAGLDSIAQASGRCNREGRSRLGHFYIFEPLNLKLRGTLGTAIENAKELLTADVDPLDPALVHKYFEMTYWKLGSELDKHRIFLGDHFIVEQLKSGVDVRFKFRAVARKFKMIDSSGSNFVVPYGTEGEYLVKKILNGDKLDREDWRKCQRYSVNVHLHTFETLIKSSSIFLKQDMPAVLINKDLYDEKIGLDMSCEHPEYLASEANVI